MKCIRIEHPMDGKGLFKSCAEYTEPSCYRHDLYNMRKRHNDFNLPNEDGLDLKKDCKEWFCAYKTVEQIQEWIKSKEFDMLIECGYEINLLEVDEYQIGHHQILFTKESIVKREIINDLFSTTVELLIPRDYHGWTEKAFVTPNGLWVPRRFCTNWTEDKPPKELQVVLPKWFRDLNALLLITYINK